VDGNGVFSDVSPTLALDYNYVGTLTATDNGGETTSINTQSIEIGDAPDKPVINNAAAIGNDQSVTISGTASDADSNLANVKVSISSDAGTWATLSVDAGGNWTHTFTGQPYATLTVSAKAVDTTDLESDVSAYQVTLQPPYQTVESNLSQHVTAGRITNYSIGYGACDILYLNLFNQYGVSTLFPLYGRDGTWCADPTNLPGPVDSPPTISIISASATDDCIYASGSVNDDNPGVSVNVTIGGSTASVDLSGTSWSIQPMCGLANGTYNVIATATDSASQTASDTQQVSVNVDGTDNPPSIVIGSAADTGNCVDASGTATDDNSGFSVSVTVDGQNATVNLSGDSWNITQMCGLVNGDYDVVATVTDSISQTASDSETVTVDVQNPCAEQSAYNYYHKTAGRAYSVGVWVPQYYTQGSDEAMSGSTWGYTTLYSTDGGTEWHVGSCSQ
ncbi:hypothetical protein KKA14_15135, partial [bacterium]|nr:hypothetical protein [bacterium]